MITSSARLRPQRMLHKRNRVCYHCAGQAVVAQLAEHVLGKDEVTSSILVNGSMLVVGGQ